MPIIDCDHRSPYATAILIGAMTWPRDPECRRQWQATFAAMLLDRVQVETDEILRNTLAQRWTENLWEPAGGFATLLETPNKGSLEKEIAKPGGGAAMLAGFSLLTLAMMTEHHPEISPSLNRAFAAVEARFQAARKAGLEIVGTSERALKQGWDAWRCVSHLWAARVLLTLAVDTTSGKRATDALPATVQQHMLFSASAWFYEFVTSFKASRSSRSLVDVPEMITLQTGIEPRKPDLPRLPRGMEAAAAGYRVRAIRQD